MNRSNREDYPPFRLEDALEIARLLAGILTWVAVVAAGLFIAVTAWDSTSWSLSSWVHLIAGVLCMYVGGVFLPSWFEARDHARDAAKLAQWTCSHDWPRDPDPTQVLVTQPLADPYLTQPYDPQADIPTQLMNWRHGDSIKLPPDV